MTLSPALPDLIRTSLRPWLERWIRQNGWQLDQIGSWAIHPGGPRVLQACSDALNLSVDQLATSRQTLTEVANMSSPTVLFILERLQQASAPRPIVLLGFGPGLTIEAALVG
jgi:predicted naringenin-chalcone synthase